METNLEFSTGLVLLRLVSRLVKSVLELAHPWAIPQQLPRSYQKQILNYSCQTDLKYGKSNYLTV
jgi:hypothetical protein